MDIKKVHRVIIEKQTSYSSLLSTMAAHCRHVYRRYSSEMQLSIFVVAFGIVLCLGCNPYEVVSKCLCEYKGFGIAEFYGCLLASSAACLGCSDVDALDLRSFEDVTPAPSV